MDVNWFPGHMAKTLREMRDHIRLVDLVVETCDARLPESSRNPELDRLLGQKRVSWFSIKRIWRIRNLLLGGWSITRSSSCLFWPVRATGGPLLTRFAS
jgi:hypothetical protein